MTGKEEFLMTISRQELKAQMIKYGFHAPDMTVTEFVEDLLPVNPKQKLGPWIITYPHGKDNPIYECPCCHASNNSVFKNFCPNCGARMDSERSKT